MNIKPVTGLGARIRALREDAGMTQRELAEAAGMRRGASDISEIERGKHAAAWVVLVALADALGASMDEFI